MGTPLAPGGCYTADMLRKALSAFLAVFTVIPAHSQVLSGRVVVPNGLGARPLPVLPGVAPGLSAPGLSLSAPSLSPALSAPALSAPALSAPALEAAGFAAPADAPPAPLPPASVPADPAAVFAARAQELFAGRALRPDQSLAVAWKNVVRPEGALPDDGELNDRVAKSPQGNVERMKSLIALFKLAGAPDADIVLQDAGRGESNVIVTKKGRTDRVVVVGAHYDAVRDGQGVIDNWTGATLVANLYQALSGVETDATIVFIGFAREEEGLVGSAKYVRSLSKAQRDKIDAMVNLDTLAVNGTFAWQGHSTQVLVDRIVQVAAATNHPAQSARLWGGDADSSSFRQAGIPAVTVFGASQDVIFDIIHSPNDNMAAFSLAHYKNAYLLLIEVLKSLDARPLGPDGRRRV